jgi:NADH-quinone oxidoreductase subunit G
VNGPGAATGDPSGFVHPHNVKAAPADYFAALESLREKLKAEPELVLLFDDSFTGDHLRRLVEFGESLGIPVKYICLVDYSNSRGAVDMGLLPDAGALTLPDMLAAGDLDVLWVIGSNPLKNAQLKGKPFVVVQEMFLTETAQAADVVFPAASAYEKNGTVTNVCGETQRLKQGVRVMGTKPDLEIFGLIAKQMGAAAVVGPWIPDKVAAEIRATSKDLPTVDGRPELIRSEHNGLFASGTLGRYSKVLNSVLEGRGNH